VRWESDGGGEFTIEEVNRPARGTSIVLHLREGEGEDQAEAGRPGPIGASHLGTSTMTCVALTTQTASSPTRRPISSTASAVIRLTRR